MQDRRSKFSVIVALAGLGIASYSAAPAQAVSTPLSNMTTVAKFTYSSGQQAENLALEPNGNVDVTFNQGHQVAQVNPSTGATTVLATLPASTNGVAATADGIVRGANGVLYVDYGAGNQSAIYMLDPSNNYSPQLFVSLPNMGWINGLALDSTHGNLLATDSTNGTVTAVSLQNKTSAVWAQGSALQPTSSTSKGANGIQVYNGNVYVSNTSTGDLLKYPINSDGSAGTMSTVATGVTSIDDFTFDSKGDVLAAENYSSQLAYIPVGSSTPQIVATTSDGLDNPSSVKISGTSVYITNAAYFVQTNPSLMKATLSS